MLDVRSGLKFFHNNHHVELLYMTDKQPAAEIWKVKLQDGSIATELFELGDHIRFTEGGASYTL